MPICGIDLVPTVLELVGAAPVTHVIDGVSAPLMRGGTLAERLLFWHCRHYANQGGFPGGAVRRGDWKLIERFEDGRVHLFDLAHDLGERHDRTALEPERTATMRAELHARYRALDAKFLRAKDGREPWRPER